MSKTITVAGPRGLRIPGAVLGQPKPVVVGPHEPVEVPDDYGRHLIRDRFAVEVAPQPKPALAKPEPAKAKS